MVFQLKESYSPFLVIASTLIIVLLIATREGKQKEIIKDFTNPKFLLIAIGITIFSIWIFNQKRETPEPEKIKNLKEATRKALSALIIASLAHIDMIFAPFFVVFILDYFLSGWV